jgi:hypothetical protein
MLGVAGGELDRLIDGGPGGDPGEEEELVGPQAQDVEDGGLEPLQGQAGEAGKYIVETAPPPEHAMHELEEEAPLPVA